MPGIRVLQQLYAEAAYRERKESEANDRDDDAGQQGWPETEARKQRRKREKHWQCRHDIPERIPGVVRNLLLGLLLDIEPDERQNRYQRKRGNEAAEPVTTLCQLGDEHDNSGCQKVLRNDPGHDLSLMDLT